MNDILNVISWFLLTIAIIWAIVKLVKSEQEVKKAIVKEKEANVQRLLSTTNKR